MKNYLLFLLLIPVVLYFYTKNKNKDITLTLNNVEINADFYSISAKITNNTNKDIIIKDLISPLEDSIALINVNCSSSHLSSLPHGNAPINTWKLLKNSTADLSLGYCGTLCKGDNFLMLKLTYNEKIIESNVKNIFLKEDFETKDSVLKITFPGVLEPSMPEKSMVEQLFDHTPPPNSNFYIID